MAHKMGLTPIMANLGFSTYTVVEKYMANRPYILVYKGPFTNLPFGIGKPSILTLKVTGLRGQFVFLYFFPTAICLKDSTT